MRLKGSHLTAAIILIVCIVWVASGVLTKPSPEPQNTTTPTTPAPARVKVSVTDSVAAPVTAEISLTGTTRAIRKIEIKTETKGRVVKVFAARGQPIKINAPIINLAMEDRLARLKEAKSLLAQKEIEFKASTQLSSKAFATRIKVATTKAERDTAAANVAAAQLDIAHSKIKAPFSGILDTRPVEIGDYLPVNSTVATLINIETLEAVIAVSETKINQVHTGSNATLIMPDGKEREGVVTYIASASSPATRTFTVKIEFDNTDLLYGDGMTVRVRLPLEQTYAHLISPGILSLSDNGEVGLNAVDTNNKVVFYAVDFVREDENGLWVSGLPKSVRLITIGQDYVKAGQWVEPHPDIISSKAKL